MSALSYSYKYRALCLWFVSAFKVNVEKALCKTKDLFDYPESLVLSFIYENRNNANLFSNLNEQKISTLQN